MKKLWNQYSYVIILIALSCISAFIISFHFHSFDSDKYVTVTIEEGDSLWQIADRFSDESSIPNKKFVVWVKKHNQISGDQIYPGEQIIIPVTRSVSITNEFASAVTK